MAEPWDRDHDLSPEELQAGLGRSLSAGEARGHVQFGPGVSPIWCDQGWDCDVFSAEDAAGETWFFKVPKRHEVQEWIRKETALLETLECESFKWAPRLGLRADAGELPYQWIAVSAAPGESLLHNFSEGDPEKLGASCGEIVRSLSTHLS